MKDKYYIENGNFYVEETLVREKMLELEPKEFVEWFNGLIAEAKKQ